VRNRTGIQTRTINEGVQTPQFVSGLYRHLNRQKKVSYPTAISEVKSLTEEGEI